MNKIISIVLILIALGGASWYYTVGSVDQTQSTQRDMLDVAAQMVGTWQSIDDDKSVVIFNENGTTIDIYDGEELGEGSWELSQNEAYEDSGLRLRIMVNGEEYNYVVWNINENELTINYLERGNTLNYKRVVTEGTDSSN
tara:strand:+ start:123 stop:545 length:423 start_codon:yes stop_codon:yes gene_type:complete